MTSVLVLVLGQPYTASRIAAALDSPAADLRATFVGQADYAPLLIRPPKTERVFILRVGYRVGARTWRGRLFDSYWSLLRQALPRAHAGHFWLGTDVFETVEAVRTGTLQRAAFVQSRGDLHLSVAPWLTAELASVGIEATTALLPPPTHAPPAAPLFPSEFVALTYLPAARFEFYGGPTILEVARRLPAVQFEIMGNTGRSTGPALSNVRWRGWVTDMHHRYSDATVVVRIPRHDGFGNTVIEGLLNARHVVYTHDVPYVHAVSPPTAEVVLGVLNELHEAHSEGVLGLNIGGREWAMDQFDEGTLVDRLRALIRDRA
jgi:hypothetical protein